MTSIPDHGFHDATVTSMTYTVDDTGDHRFEIEMDDDGVWHPEPARWRLRASGVVASRMIGVSWGQETIENVTEGVSAKLTAEVTRMINSGATAPGVSLSIATVYGSKIEIAAASLEIQRLG